MLINTDKMMYVVFKNGDFLFIDAICSNRDSLKKYIEKQRKEIEDDLNSKPLEVEAKIKETLFDEEYEISSSVPSDSIAVEYSELIDFDDMSKNDIKKVWVAHCLTPHLEITLHSSEESAKAKIDAIENKEEDDPYDTLNLVQEWEVLH